MNVECLVCTENFNLSKRTRIICPICSFVACMSCCQRYILDQEVSICMNKDKNSDGSYLCQKEWSRKFITNNFPKTWVNNQWKNMNKKVDFEREKALFAATIPILKQRKEIRLLEIETSDIENKIYELNQSKKITYIENEINGIEQQISFLNHRKWNLNQQIQSGCSVVNFKEVTLGKICPDIKCRGYISSQWKCGLCDKWICRECHEIKRTSCDTEHNCNPDTKSTIQLLNSDTKQCPKCAIHIHKIEGCDQMWCTKCHTAFSWLRGTIETRIHNPHYYEWIRNNNSGTSPRNVGNFECGRDLTDDCVSYMFEEIINALYVGHKSLPVEIEDIRIKIIAIIRNTIHLSDVQAPRFHTNNVIDNLELRVKYLDGKMDEKRFASRIHAANKKFHEKRDISDVIQFQVQGVTDIVYRMIDALRYPGGISDPWPDRAAHEKFLWFKGSLFTIYSNLSLLYDEFNVLTNYSNAILVEHSVTYNSRPYIIYLINSKKNGDVMY